MINTSTQTSIKTHIVHRIWRVININKHQLPWEKMELPEATKHYNNQEC